MQAMVIAGSVSTRAKACLLVYLVLSGHALPPLVENIGGKLRSQVPAPPNTSTDEASLFARPVEFMEVMQRLAYGPRRLDEELQVDKGWEFPVGTRVQFKSDLADAVYGSGALVTQTMKLMAGYKYQEIQVVMPNAPGGDDKEFWTFGVAHNGATIKLVDAAADRTQCDISYNDVAMMSSPITAGGDPVPSPLALGATELMKRLKNVIYKPLTSPYLMFMMGGTYKLCYTPDGTFTGDEWKNAMVPILITVGGVRSPCNTNDCLAQERWDCFFSYRAELEGPCVFDFRSSGRPGWSVIEGGSRSLLSWSARWNDDVVYSLNGALVYIPSTAKTCSDSLSDHQEFTINPELTLFASNTIDYSQAAGWNPMPSIRADSVTRGSMPSINGSAANKSITLTVCYCPNYDGKVFGGTDACVDPTEYIQPIGRIYYWMLRICSSENYLRCGVTDLPSMRVVPQQPFVLRLQCPPGGPCAGATANRLHFQDPTTEYGYVARPSWDPLTRCKDPDVPASDGVMWLPKDTDLPLDGGVRRDYKIWQQRHMQLMRTFQQSVDVCYCDDNCDNQANFFHVGRIQTGELGIARWSKDVSKYTVGSTDFAPIETLKYIGKTGSITLYGGISSPMNASMEPYDSPPFGKSALVKVISFDRDKLYTMSSTTGLPVYDPTSSERNTLEKTLGLDSLNNPDAQSQLDAACATTPYLDGVVSGITTENLARDFVAYIPDGTLTNYMPFTGVENDQAVQARKTGILSICYCAMINDASKCASASHWLHAAKLMAMGPLGGQSIVLPTYTVVDMDFDGWGFTSSNTLRFVDMTQSCAENNYSPLAQKYFRLGCPAVNGTGCRFPTEMEDIYTFIDSFNTTGLKIINVEFNDYNATLTFDGDIAGVRPEQLQIGESITIDPSTVLLNGIPYSQLSPAQRYIVARLTGIYEYADDAKEVRLLPRKVSYVYKRNGDLDATKVSVNIGFLQSEMPLITFIGCEDIPPQGWQCPPEGGGKWERRNLLRTRQEFLATEPVQTKICFAVTDGDPLEQKYYAEAGTIQFIQPTKMDFVGVHLTAQVSGGQAPVILSFVPKRGLEAYKTFETAFILRILFHDTSGMVEPLVSGDLSAATLEPLNPLMEVAMENATQALCGQMFTEMWTNDADGFPLPKGCYFGVQYKNAPTPPNYEPTPAWREYFIIFEKKNGMKSTCFDYRLDQPSSCLYLLVFNANVKTIPAGSKAVSNYVMCEPQPGGATPCGPKYSPLEYGVAALSGLSMSPDPSKATIGQIEVGDHGTIRGKAIGTELLLDAPVDAVKGVKEWGLEIRIWQNDPLVAIERGASVRIFFSPYSLWDIGLGDCDVNCYPPVNKSCSDGRAGTTGKCMKDTILSTSFDQVVSMPRNLLYMTYPAMMDELAETNETEGSLKDQHILRLEDGIILPSTGFFPTKFLVQLTDSLDASPSAGYTVTRYHIVPARGQTVGRLLVSGQTGSGSKPFVNDRGNPMTMYIRLGVTLRHNGSNVQPVFYAPRIEIELPVGYTCFIDGDGSVDPGGTMKLFTRDRDADGYYDYYKGILRQGYWTASKRHCWYTLDPYATVFAGQKFFLAIIVDNPLSSMARSDPINVWYIKTLGMEKVQFGHSVRFLTLEEEKKTQYLGWQGNLAVIRDLRRESIQPVTFAPGASQWVNVFFKAVHDMPPMSFIVLDAPLDFDFGQECKVKPLEENYYIDWHALPWGEDLFGERSRARPIGRVYDCFGDVWGRDPFDPLPTVNFTRAQVRVAEKLYTGAEYGFSIHLRNGYHYNTAQHDGWKLWIFDLNKYIYDGSRYTVQLSPARIASVPDNKYDRSWGLYASDLKVPVTFDWGATTLFPTVASGMTPSVTIYPIQVGINRFTDFRVIAPVGYKWDIVSPNGFVGYVEGLTCSQCKIIVAPAVEYENELLLKDVGLRGGNNYGFKARIHVPVRPPTRSSNFFSIELGYRSEAGSNRLQAGIVHPLPLRVIHDASIYSLCNVQDYLDNTFEFHFRTVSDLHSGDGFVFEGDEGSRNIELLCFPTAVPGKMPLPIDIQCSISTDRTSGLPTVMLYAFRTSLPAGSYGIRFEKVRNPAAPGGLVPGTVGAHWYVGSYRHVTQYPQMETADVGISVPAPRIQAEMRMAGIVHAPVWEQEGIGRDDRPGRFNRLTFYFKLRAPATFTASVKHLQISLRGPEGFYFLPDCLHQLHMLNVTDPPKPPTTSTTTTVTTTSTTSTTTSTTSTSINPNITYDENLTLIELNINFSNTSFVSTTTTSRSTSTTTTSTTTTQTTTTTITTTTTTPIPNATWPCMPTNYQSQAWCTVTIQDWPDEMRPTNCIGIGNTVKITVPNPQDVFLLGETMYGFQIGVTNPISMAGHTKWALDFASEASLPFESFTLRTFDPETTVMKISSTAVNTEELVAHAGVPMSFTFTPSLFVPSIQYGVFGGRRLQNFPPNADEGILELQAPEGFIFSMINIDEGINDGKTKCSRSVLEVASRSEGDTVGIFTEGVDMLCTVVGSNKTRIQLQGEKALFPGTTYRYSFYVSNPSTEQEAAPWILSSFKEKIDFRVPEYGQIVPLDMIKFPGFATTSSLTKFIVDNLSQEYNGGFQVRRIRIVMQFSENLMDGDMVILSAPYGFNLVTTSILGHDICTNFQYPNVLLPLINTPDPNCTCTLPGPKCKLVFNPQEGAANRVALLRVEELEFEIGGVNPISSPEMVENNWRAEHMRDGKLISSSDIPGWLVYAQPQNITVDVTGLFKRAFTESEISVSFVPTAWASALQLTITEPSGFDFSQVLVNAPLERDERSGIGKLVVVRGDFQTGVRSYVVAKKVRLGAIGGKTKMNFILYEDLFLSYPVGRRYNFTGGFRLPGSLDIRDQQLLSEPVVAHYERNQIDAVQPLLPARSGLLTRIEITFSVTMPVNFGERLNFKPDVSQSSGSQPNPLYYDSDHPPTLDHCTMAPSTASPHTSCNPIGAVNITNVDYTEVEKIIKDFSLTLAHAAFATPGGMVMPSILEPVLIPKEIYRLRVWCLPNTDVNYWRIETDDGGDLPTNTNDGITLAIGSVAPMDVDVTAIRTPPSSVIDSRLVVQPGAFSSEAEQMRIFLPVGFTEGTQTGVYRATDHPSFADTGRIIAKYDLLYSQRTGLASSGAVLNPRVMSPASTGSDPRWFVLLYKWPADALQKTEDNAEIVAWGIFDGWILDPLNVTLTYANIEFFTGSVALYFTVPLLASGVYAIIRAPDGFVLGCPKSQAGRPVPACNFNPPEVNLTLTGMGVIEGSNRVYSFLVPMKTPEIPPEVNNWDVRIYDYINNVVDGCVGIQKETFVQGMYLDDPFIQWKTTPQRGEMSDVVVSVTLNRRVWRLRALLISMPEGYRHDIQHPNQFKALTKTFPIAIDVPWRNYENLRWVRVLIAKAASSVDFVPSGTYQFQYPVMLPIYKPLSTEWYLSLCRDYVCQNVDPPDPGIIVSFPMPQPAALLPVKTFRPVSETGDAERLRFSLFVEIVLLRMLWSTCVQTVT